MTNAITYEFEELQPFPGHAVYINGSADIEYEEDPGDAYTGARGGYSYWVTRISINSDKKDLGDLNLDGANPLYSLIENQLTGINYSDHVLQKIEDNEEEF